MSMEVRLLRSEEYDQAATLIYESLNQWYQKNRGFKLVTGPVESMLLFPRVYEALDPHCCVVVEDNSTGRLSGTCFFHPRPTHVSLGIMNVHPDYFGQGVGSMLLKYIIDIAEARHQSLRLVSSAMNLESFCLYNRYGFVPTIFFQDMTVRVPEKGFAIQCPEGKSIHRASFEDIPAMVALERELYSIEREKDFRFFIQNEDNIWRTSLLVDEKSGELEGFVSSVLDPGSHMIGPGVSRTEEGMAALIRYELNACPGKTPVWLIPSHCLKLRQSMFELGAKNCELHIGQVRGEYTAATGVIIPSFMPETS